MKNAEKAFDDPSYNYKIDFIYPWINKIIEIIASKHGITTSEILHGRNNPKFVIANHHLVVALYIEIPCLSLRQIGQVSGGKDHKTIQYILRKFDAWPDRAWSEEILWLQPLVHMRGKPQFRPRALVGAERRQGPLDDCFGKIRTAREVQEIFRKFYGKNNNVILSAFPLLSRTQMHDRARRYKVSGNRMNDYSPSEINLIKRLFPDYSSIKIAMPHRSLKSIHTKAVKLGLPEKRGFFPRWTSEEDTLLRAGAMPIGRSHYSCISRMQTIGIRSKIIKKTRSMTGDALRRLVCSIVPKNLPTQIREEVEEDLIVRCLEGSLSPDKISIFDELKKYISRVYKLHPDRGAPISLDARVYDEGSLTVGDCIDSTVFRF